MSLFHALKRARDESPSSNKRRVPSTYQPQATHQLSSGFRQGGGWPRGEESEVRSEGGDNWVRRTEGLQLATPPAEVGWAGDGDDGMMMDSDHFTLDSATHLPSTFPDRSIHPPPPLATTPFYTSQPVHNQSYSSSSSSTPSATPAPHHPPPLSSNLAGSPYAASPSASMSRSHSTSSSSSVASMFSPHEFDYAAANFSIPSHLDPQPVEARSADEEMQVVPASPAVASRRAGRGAGGHAKAPVRFSMGYRADCEKCVRRVAGHYSHVVNEDGVVQVEPIAGAAAGTRWR